MANKLDNLMPIQEVNARRTREQRSEDSRRAGIKSGEARRRKATMRETLKLLLETEAKNGQTYKELATIGLIKGAVKGNSNNYRVILETLGELFEAEQKKQSNGVIDNLIEALNNVKNSK